MAVKGPEAIAGTVITMIQKVDDVCPFTQDGLTKMGCACKFALIDQLADSRRHGEDVFVYVGSYLTFDNPAMALGMAHDLVRKSGVVLFHLDHFDAAKSRQLAHYGVMHGTHFTRGFGPNAVEVGQEM